MNKWSRTRLKIKNKNENLDFITEIQYLIKSNKKPY